MSIETSLPENQRRRAERLAETVRSYRRALDSLAAARGCLTFAAGGERHPIAADESTLHLLSVTERVIAADLVNLQQLAHAAQARSLG